MDYGIGRADAGNMQIYIGYLYSWLLLDDDSTS